MSDEMALRPEDCNELLTIEQDTENIAACLPTNVPKSIGTTKSYGNIEIGGHAQVIIGDQTLPHDKDEDIDHRPSQFIEFFTTLLDATSFALQCVGREGIFKRLAGVHWNHSLISACLTALRRYEHCLAQHEHFELKPKSKNRESNILLSAANNGLVGILANVRVVFEDVYAEKIDCLYDSLADAFCANCRPGLVDDISSALDTCSGDLVLCVLLLKE